MVIGCPGGPACRSNLWSQLAIDEHGPRVLSPRAAQIKRVGCGRTGDSRVLEYVATCFRCCLASLRGEIAVCLSEQRGVLEIRLPFAVDEVDRSLDVGIVEIVASQLRS